MPIWVIIALIVIAVVGAYFLFKKPQTTDASVGASPKPKGFDPSTGAIPSNYAEAEAVVAYSSPTTAQLDAATTIIHNSISGNTGFVNPFNPFG